MRSATVRLKRAAKVTVTGKLTRANRETKKYGGYGGRSAEL